jgi:hypothetical protein
MPIGTPTSLATPVSSTSTTSGTITTSVTAPSDSLIIVIAGWGFGTDRTATVTGGGLTFGTAGSADQSSVQSFGYFLRIGIYSAPAASGLASGATFTLTPSANFDGSLMSAYYVTGMDLTGSRLDANTGAGAATGGWTSGSDTTTNAVDSELHDWQFATNAWTACTAYRIESSAGSKALTGDWVANANHVAAMAGYKSGSPAEFTAGGFDLRNRLGRERGRFPLRGNKWY